MWTGTVEVRHKERDENRMSRVTLDLFFDFFLHLLNPNFRWNAWEQELTKSCTKRSVGEEASRWRCGTIACKEEKEVKEKS